MEYPRDKSDFINSQIPKPHELLRLPVQWVVSMIIRFISLITDTRANQSTKQYSGVEKSKHDAQS